MCGRAFVRRYYFTAHIHKCIAPRTRDTYRCSCNTLCLRTSDFIVHSRGECSQAVSRRQDQTFNSRGSKRDGTTTKGRANQKANKSGSRPQVSTVLQVNESLSISIATKSEGENFDSQITEFDDTTNEKDLCNSTHPVEQAMPNSAAYNYDVTEHQGGRYSSEADKRETPSIYAVNADIATQGQKPKEITESWLNGLSNRSGRAGIPTGTSDSSGIQANESPVYSSFDHDHSMVTDSDLLSISEFSEVHLELSQGLTPLQNAILSTIMLDYDQSRQRQAGSGNSGDVYATPTASTSSSCLSLSVGRGSKRKLGQDTSFGDNENSVSVKSAKQETFAPDRQQVLACPYWKRDSEKYRACCKLAHKRIRDVKQHLHRRHTPEFYCQRCFETFEDGTRHEIHVASITPCVRPTGAQLEGLSTTQSRALTRKSDRRLTEEKQWFAVWDIVFPGINRPGSAYVDLELSEDMISFQEYWENRGHDILIREMDSSGIWNLSQEERDVQGRHILARGLTRIYAQWSNRRSLAISPSTSSTVSNSLSESQSIGLPTLPTPSSSASGSRPSDVVASNYQHQQASVDPALRQANIPEVPLNPEDIIAVTVPQAQTSQDLEIGTPNHNFTSDFDTPAMHSSDYQLPDNFFDFCVTVETPPETQSGHRYL